ncbi:glutamate-rich protein 2 isoform X2 [Neofelis nebulosa]|uniref:glutamate-rich protein 2 isoform X2 n=1 Tax=Neofelis nebulosa TaxID=61452 RepID=UPI002729A831|nr:glutamate-rich protein 2 isoform X2 [Neofelis nebulosa]
MFALPLYPVLDWLSFLSLASQASRGPVLSHLPLPAPSTAPPVRPASFLALSVSPSSSRPRPSPSASLSRNQGSGSARSRLHGDAVCTATSSEHRANPELGWPSVSALRKGGVKEPRAGSGSGAPRLPRRRSKSKCLFGRRPRLASKLCTSPTQVSLNVARTISEKKEVSSKNIENTASLRNTENRASSKNIENKDTETNLQSKLWSSSFLKESIGQVGKDAVLQEQEKNNKRCLQDIDDKLSESTDDDGEDDTSDDDNDEDSHPNKDTHAPLELMAEFLRAEMGQDYHLAKKLCQMILIYEPENPEAKEFFSLIEEMLLMEKSQNLEEDDEDSEEDSSSESEGESSEELSEESSDECEDG